MKGKKFSQLLDTNPFEAIKEIGGNTAEVVRTQTQGSVDDLWRQLLGAESPKKFLSGDLIAGQAIDFSGHKKADTSSHEVTHHAEKPKNLNIAAGIDYHREIIKGENRISKETEQILSQQIEQITIELRQLVNSSQALAVEFKDVAVQQHITKPGKYHVSLFQFILTIVKQARQKVEHSGSWLAAAKGRKKKQNYWDLFEEQGTSFALNNERAIATQAG